MAKARVGKLPPRYTLLMNPYADERVSKCPQCRKPTHPRKFALLVLLEGGQPLAQGKTCPYCTPCELIVVHQAELEAELAHGLSSRAPEMVGCDYLLVGTMDRRVWQRSLSGGAMLGEARDSVADFKKQLVLHVEPGGWRPASGP